MVTFLEPMSSSNRAKLPVTSLRLKVCSPGLKYTSAGGSPDAHFTLNSVCTGQSRFLWTRLLLEFFRLTQLKSSPRSWPGGQHQGRQIWGWLPLCPWCPPPELPMLNEVLARKEKTIRDMYGFMVNTIWIGVSCTTCCGNWGLPN